MLCVEGRRFSIRSTSTVVDSCLRIQMFEEGDSENGVYCFLQSIGQEKHWDIFKAKGYDRESDLVDITEDDLECMHMTDDDRDVILEAARHFHVSDGFLMQCWLEEQGLGHYYDNLKRCDVTNLRQLEDVELDAGVFTELEMDVPGHRKRFAKAVRQLKKRRRLSESDDVMCEGYWGKPEPLVEAKNDFLCLKATLKSTQTPSKAVSLEFMVDSGSDVVTVRENLIADLDLEYMGTIQSQGVHAKKLKPLYKGIINIGGTDIETEVMSETYESIGNQVLRNFRHYIDAHRHLWLPSHHRFLPPADLAHRPSRSVPTADIAHPRSPPLSSEEEEEEDGAEEQTSSLGENTPEVSSRRLPEDRTEPSVEAPPGESSGTT